MLRSLTAAALGVVLLCATASAQAQPDEIRQGRPLYYTASVLEASLLLSGVLMAGAMALDDGSGGVPSEGGMLLASSLLLGISAGYASDQNDWDPNVALAMHGGIWTTATLAMIGALIDGRDETEGSALSFGPWTILLGFLGSALGILVGQTQHDTGLEAGLWYLAPLAGGLAALISWLALDPWQDAGADPAAQDRRAWTSAVGGFAACILASHVFTLAVTDPS